MRNALRLVVALSGASVVGAVLLIACSDDTSVNASADGGPAPGPDSSFDGGEGGGGDGGADTSPPFDGGFVLDTFDTRLATELCGSLARCCYGTTMPAEGGADGGTFDQTACVAHFERIGFQNSQLGTEIKDGGNVVLDQVSADDCITKIKGLSCDLPGPEFSAARAACFKVYSGKFAAGQACKGAVECQHGLYCKGQVDGGAGVCTAIQALNGPCGANPSSDTEYEETCSYRGSGDTSNYCKFYEFTGPGAGDLDAGDWKCTAAAGMGAPCATGTWCKDTICDPTTFACTSPDQIFQQSCGAFLKP